MTICTRPGCGVDFDPSSTSSRKGPCMHHPGKPVFHEGSKSWSCCKDRNKPVLEFDEFMLIKGCTESDEHTDVKQAKTSFAKENSGDVTTEAPTSNGQANTPAPIASTSSLTPMSSTRLNAIQQQNAQRSQKADPASLFVEEEDPAGAVVGEGAPCKRKGCNEKFAGTSRDRNSEECRFHPGQPIFHEGSKGYACCKRRVLEFDEFLTIEPCTEAKTGHLFVGGGAKAIKSSQTNGPPSGKDTDEIEADCRIDHYETPNDVRVTVYAKGVEMDRSKITLEGESVTFSLALPALPAQPEMKRRYNRILKPYGAIDVEASSFSVTRFKVDLILVKQSKGESWPALERGDQALGYGLTFGRKLDA
ncbi:chord-domain-containing protein [Meira miltonrushii]|uniref:Chord-domain-containing protein n=1 Tax=Meira miltonrushii TaxID=1280837 RepID=A0A316VIM5_9BASI|nr:chord-domain-containing protein [Meira miltonrushii]PWN37452.1 chord-domain-containing protein [Meira miltonrushii]